MYDQNIFYIIYNIIFYFTDYNIFFAVNINEINYSHVIIFI